MDTELKRILDTSFYETRQIEFNGKVQTAHISYQENGNDVVCVASCGGFIGMCMVEDLVMPWDHTPAELADVCKQYAMDIEALRSMRMHGESVGFIPAEMVN